MESYQNARIAITHLFQDTWARHFTLRKYWLITQEAVAPSQHDWKIVDWDVKPQHKQTKSAWGLVFKQLPRAPANVNAWKKRDLYIIRAVQCLVEQIFNGLKIDVSSFIMLQIFKTCLWITVNGKIFIDTNHANGRMPSSVLLISDTYCTKGL